MKFVTKVKKVAAGRERESVEVAALKEEEEKTEEKTEEETEEEIQEMQVLQIKRRL